MLARSASEVSKSIGRVDGYLNEWCRFLVLAKMAQKSLNAYIRISTARWGKKIGPREAEKQP
jgi:hypothetical protein